MNSIFKTLIILSFVIFNTNCLTFSYDLNKNTNIDVPAGSDFTVSVNGHDSTGFRWVIDEDLEALAEKGLIVENENGVGTFESEEKPVGYTGAEGKYVFNFKAKERGVCEVKFSEQKAGNLEVTEEILSTINAYAFGEENVERATGFIMSDEDLSNDKENKERATGFIMSDEDLSAEEENLVLFTSLPNENIDTAEEETKVISTELSNENIDTAFEKIKEYVKEHSSKTNLRSKFSKVTEFKFTFEED